MKETRKMKARNLESGITQMSTRPQTPARPQMPTRRVHRARLSVLGAVAAGLALACSAAWADAKPFNWKFAEYQQPTTSYARGWEPGLFQPLKEQGIANVKGYYQESLLSATDILSGVADGRADLGFISILYFPRQLPLSQLASVPFMGTNAEAAVQTYAELYQTNKKFKEEYDKAGVHIVSFVPLNPTVLGSREKITDIAGLVGKKIRAAALQTATLKEIKALPIALTAPEIYQSLDTGVIDGYTSVPFDAAVVMSLPEVAPYTADTGMGLYNMGVLLMTKKIWDGLSQAQKDKIDAIVASYQGVAMNSLKTTTLESCKKIQEQKGTIVVWSDEAKKQYKDAIGDSVLGIWKAQTAKAGLSEQEIDDFLAEYLAVYHKYDQASSYVSGERDCVE